MPANIRMRPTAPAAVTDSISDNSSRSGSYYGSDGYYTDSDASSVASSDVSYSGSKSDYGSSYSRSGSYYGSESESISDTYHGSTSYGGSGTYYGSESYSGSDSYHGSKSYGGSDSYYESKSYSGSGTYSGSKRYGGSDSYYESKSYSGSGTYSGSKSYGGSGSYYESKSHSGSGTYSGSKSYGGSGSYYESNSRSGSGTYSGSKSYGGSGSYYESKSYSGSATYSGSNSSSGSNAVPTASSTPKTISISTVSESSATMPHSSKVDTARRVTSLLGESLSWPGSNAGTGLTEVAWTSRHASSAAKTRDNSDKSSRAATSVATTKATDNVLSRRTTTVQPRWPSRMASSAATTIAKRDGSSGRRASRRSDGSSKAPMSVAVTSEMLGRLSLKSDVRRTTVRGSRSSRRTGHSGVSHYSFQKPVAEIVRSSRRSSGHVRRTTVRGSRSLHRSSHSGVSHHSSQKPVTEFVRSSRRSSGPSKAATVRGSRSSHRTSRSSASRHASRKPVAATTRHSRPRTRCVTTCSSHSETANSSFAPRLRCTTVTDHSGQLPRIVTIRSEAQSNRRGRSGTMQKTKPSPRRRKARTGNKSTATWVYPYGEHVTDRSGITSSLHDNQTGVSDARKTSRSLRSREDPAIGLDDATVKSKRTDAEEQTSNINEKPQLQCFVEQVHIPTTTMVVTKPEEPPVSSFSNGYSDVLPDYLLNASVYPYPSLHQAAPTPWMNYAKPTAYHVHSYESQ